jgi:hypothetical protein
MREEELEPLLQEIWNFPNSYLFSFLNVRSFTALLISLITEFGRIHPFQNNLSARKTGASPSHDINSVYQQRNFDVWKQ